MTRRTLALFHRVMDGEARIRVKLLEAAVFPWSDGDWIVQADVQVDNGLEQPAIVAPEQFAIAGSYFRWPRATTLAATPIAPGGTARGMVAWYCSRTLPRPNEAHFSWSQSPGGEALWQTDRTLILRPERTPEMPTTLPFEPPVPPVPPQPINVPPPFPQPPIAPYGTYDTLVQAAIVQAATIRECDVRLESAATFHWTDGDWILRVNVTVAHRGSTAFIVARQLFAATAHGLAMRLWQPATSFPEVVPLEPGASVSGAVGWYYGGSLPQPDKIVVAYGAPGRPTFYASTQATLDERAAPTR